MSWSLGPLLRVTSGRSVMLVLRTHGNKGTELFQKNGYDFNACNNISDNLYNTDIINSIVKLIVHCYLWVSFFFFLFFFFKVGVCVCVVFVFVLFFGLISPKCEQT